MDSSNPHTTDFRIFTILLETPVGWGFRAPTLYVRTEEKSEPPRIVRCFTGDLAATGGLLVEVFEDLVQGLRETVFQLPVQLLDVERRRRWCGRSCRSHRRRHQVRQHLVDIAQTGARSRACGREGDGEDLLRQHAEGLRDVEDMADLDVDPAAQQAAHVAAAKSELLFELLVLDLREPDQELEHPGQLFRLGIRHHRPPSMNQSTSSDATLPESLTLALRRGRNVPRV